MTCALGTWCDSPYALLFIPILVVGYLIFKWLSNKDNENNYSDSSSEPEIKQEEDNMEYDDEEQDDSEEDEEVDDEEEEPDRECSFQNNWQSNDDEKYGWSCGLMNGNEDKYCEKSLCPFWKDAKIEPVIKNEDASTSNKE